MTKKEMSKRPFRRYKIEVTVLVVGEIPSDMSLVDIALEGRNGMYVIDYDVDSDPITGKMMADAMCEAGSEAEFFELDGDGCDADD